MMFCGGEIGIEELLPKLAQVKKSKIWLEGEITWSISDQFPKDVFGILRTLENEALFTVINFSDSEITVGKENNFKTKSALVEVGESVVNLPDAYKIPALSGSILKLEKLHN